MKIKRTLFILGSLSILTLVINNSSLALTTSPQVAQDKESGYDQSFFKHWIDENKNGCDTRAEVLISEAVVKPKVDKKCKITGGKWLSAYDGKSVTNASQLVVDHLVPLAEAWRSGAWAWTPKQRQDYANDLGDKRTLIAVTLTTNRSKGDQDISDWIPKVDPCGYVQNWIAIKVRYSLTYDIKEAKSLSSFFEICKFGDISAEAISGYTYQAQTVQPAQPSPTPTASNSPIKLMDYTPMPTASPGIGGISGSYFNAPGSISTYSDLVMQYFNWQGTEPNSSSFLYCEGYNNSSLQVSYGITSNPNDLNSATFFRYSSVFLYYNVNAILNYFKHYKIKGKYFICNVSKKTGNNGTPLIFLGTASVPISTFGLENNL